MVALCTDSKQAAATDIQEVGPPPLGEETVDPTTLSGELVPGVAVTATDRSCINTGRIRTWRVLDRSNLVIYAPTRETPYHVSVTGFCQDMDRAQTSPLGFVSQTSRLCAGAGSEIVIGESRCRIRSITAIDQQTADTLIAQYDVRRQLRGKR